LIDSFNLNESLVFDQTGCSSKETWFISFCAFACVCEKKTKKVNTKSDAYKLFLVKPFSTKNLFLLIHTEYGFSLLLVREIFLRLIYMGGTSNYAL